MRNRFLYGMAAPFLGLSLVPGLVTVGHAQSLEEVVVTATRQEESLQDVPVSVAAISRDTIGYMGVVDI